MARVLPPPIEAFSLKEGVLNNENDRKDQRGEEFLMRSEAKKGGRPQSAPLNPETAESLGRRVFFADGRQEETEGFVLSEHELFVKIDGGTSLRLVCTREYLRELVFGRLLSEGLINTAEDIIGLSISPDEKEARVCLKEGINTGRKEALVRNAPSFITSTGDRTFPLFCEPLKKLSEVCLKPEWIFSLSKIFEKDSRLHSLTWAAHSCILAKEGEALFSCEDIGRHNALDKAIGYALINGAPLNECMLFISGRVPMDMVAKVAAAGVPVLVSKASPTKEAALFARKCGIFLICRARPDRYEVFAP